MYLHINIQHADAPLVSHVLDCLDGRAVHVAAKRGMLDKRFLLCTPC